MMTKSEAKQRLLRLQQEHEADRDGGYDLVTAVRRVQDELSPEDRAVLTEILGDLARAEQRLWGIALEALVQSGDREQVFALGGEIASTTHSDEWKDRVVLGLLRVGEQRLREPIVAYLRASLNNRRSLTVPTLAALSRIDRETCLELAVGFFEDAHVKKLNVDGYIPAFVSNFVEVDDAMIGELIGRLRARRMDAGQSLAASFDEWLSKPWTLKELGAERVGRLRGDLRAPPKG